MLQVNTFSRLNDDMFAFLYDQCVFFVLVHLILL